MIMTEYERELVSLYNKANDETRQFMFDALTMAVAFGDEWFEAMEEHVKNKDRNGMIQTLERFKVRLEARTEKSKA